MDITKTQPITMKSRPYKYFVLHVEDDELVGNAVARHLEKNGYRVTSARTVREGTATFLDNLEQWNAVIIDLLLPDNNGISLFELFREHRPDMPILVLSGDTI